MKNFEYAAPVTESDAVELLSPDAGRAAVLAGGSDLVGLMKQMVETPDRVIHIGRIESMRRIELRHDGEVWVGAGVHLDEFFESPLTRAYPAVNQVLAAISSVQMQSQGTIGGELLQRPACWYYRDGRGLLAGGGKLVVEGDNRYHAILGNQGPAKFVSPSRLAPAMIALGARVRIVGPEKSKESIADLESLYQTPQGPGEREHALAPGQLITHVILPPDRGLLSAAYEIRHGAGPDPPLAAAAVAMSVRDQVVEDARVVLGHVAPMPWISTEAALALQGQPLTEAVAKRAGLEATSRAAPLSQNEYKVQLTQVAVRRAILRAAAIAEEESRDGVPSFV